MKTIAKQLLGILLIIGSIECVATAAEDRPSRTDWLMEARIGAFAHFLPHPSNGTELVNGFDVDALADQLASIGAKYYMFSLGQNSGWYNAPNSTYDRIAGLKAGERCSKRDLPLELFHALNAKGIRLMLYLPCQAPKNDPGMKVKFGLPESKRDRRIDIPFARKWAAVIQEWSVRYGDKVSGWWFDGGYTDWANFNDEIADIYADAVRRGNPNAIVTFNPGIMLIQHTKAEDYTAGELNEPFEVLPKDRWVNGSQWHVLTYLGSKWFRRDTRYSTEQWVAWISKVVSKGGAVTLDMGPNMTRKDGPIGRFGNEQAEQFREIVKRVNRTR